MNGVVPYFGGKHNLAKRIIEKIPEHTCYVEAFAGGASVFFAKEPSKAEVINDIDRDVVTLYRVIKHHPEELYRQYKYCLTSRAEFEREKNDVNADGLTDIQRAARYLYLQKNGFGGSVTHRAWGTATTRARFNVLSLESVLEQAWLRLAGVYVESKDFRDILTIYDRPHTFFFLDPPYWRIKEYNHNFGDQDFIDLAALLRGLQGKFLMTLNDTPEVRDIFAGFNREEVTLKYTCTRSVEGRKKLRTELLFSNY